MSSANCYNNQNAFSRDGQLFTDHAVHYLIPTIVGTIVYSLYNIHYTIYMQGLRPQMYMIASLPKSSLPSANADFIAKQRHMRYN